MGLLIPISNNEDGTRGLAPLIQNHVFGISVPVPTVAMLVPKLKIFVQQRVHVVSLY